MQEKPTFTNIILTRADPTVMVQLIQVCIDEKGIAPEDFFASVLGLRLKPDVFQSVLDVFNSLARTHYTPDDIQAFTLEGESNE